MSGIPDHAKQVFNGILFDVYHWEQEMFDGTTATFEMLSRKASTEVIMTVADKIILLIQDQPGRETYPSLPGGRIDPGEKPLEAATREMTEDTGYTSDDVELLYHFTGNSKLYFPEYIYIAREAIKTTDVIPDAGERFQLKLVSFDEFLHTVRDPLFAVSWGLKIEMVNALVDSDAYDKLKQRIFG